MRSKSHHMLSFKIGSNIPHITPSNSPALYLHNTPHRKGSFNKILLPILSYLRSYCTIWTCVGCIISYHCPRSEKIVDPFWNVNGSRTDILFCYQWIFSWYLIELRYLERFNVFVLSGRERLWFFHFCIGTT